MPDLAIELAKRLPFEYCPPPSGPTPPDWELDFLTAKAMDMVALRSRLNPKDSYGSPWQWEFKNGFLSEGHRDLKEAEVDELRAFWEVIESGWPWLSDVAAVNLDFPQTPINLYRELLCERWLYTVANLRLQEERSRAVPGFTKLCRYFGDLNAGREVDPSDLKELAIALPLKSEVLGYLRGIGDRAVNRKIRAWEKSKRYCAHQLAPLANRQRKGRSP